MLAGRAVVAVVVLFAVAARAAPATLVVYHAPPGAGAEVAAARDALGRVAAAAGAPFLDLSPAPSPAPGAPPLIARAAVLYEALRLDDARAALDAALAEARASGAAGLTARQLSDLFLFRALVASQRHDAATEWDDLVRAATIDETRVLDPARFPPRVERAFGRALAAVRALGHGRLTVAGAPPCRAWIDGREASAPPLLAYGEHFARVECPGARAAGAVVVLARPQQDVALPRITIAAPDDATVLALARERAAARVLLATVTASALAPPTARLRLLDGRSGATLAESSIALAGAVAAERARAVAERMLAPRPQAELVARPRPASPRWYRRPWFWALVGGAAATAALLPFVISRGGSASGFSVRAASPLWP